MFILYNDKNYNIRDDVGIHFGTKIYDKFICEIKYFRIINIHESCKSDLTNKFLLEYCKCLEVLINYIFCDKVDYRMIYSTSRNSGIYLIMKFPIVTPQVYN